MSSHILAWRKASGACLLHYALRTSPALGQFPSSWCLKRDMATVTQSPPHVSVNPAAYCRDMVRKQDYESYMVGQFFPPDKQDGYFALKAFYIELARIPDEVSNPMIGQMRMQFWRDCIKQVSDGTPSRHPIAEALSETVKQTKLPAYHLKRIVDARDSELSNPTHMTVDSLTAHAESTSSTLLYLLLSLLSLNSSELSHAASHLGVAQTLTTLLRGLPFHASKGRMIIPSEITAKHGVSQEAVFRSGGQDVEGLEDAIYEFATVANDHMITARSMFKEDEGKVPGVAMPIFLAGIPAANFLERLERANFNVFLPTLQTRDWRLPWRLWRAYYKRSF